MKQIPEIGKEYNAFDDGKIRPSRLYKVLVKAIIPFTEIDQKTKELWELEVEQCYWLYNKETDYFIITDNYEDEDQIEVFVRTKDGGWFSMGEFLGGGRLDVDEELFECMKENYPHWEEV